MVYGNPPKKKEKQMKTEVVVRSGHNVKDHVEEKTDLNQCPNFRNRVGEREDPTSTIQSFHLNLFTFFTLLIQFVLKPV